MEDHPVVPERLELQELPIEEYPLYLALYWTMWFLRDFMNHPFVIRGEFGDMTQHPNYLSWTDEERRSMPKPSITCSYRDPSETIDRNLLYTGNWFFMTDSLLPRSGVSIDGTSVQLCYFLDQLDDESAVVGLVNLDNPDISLEIHEGIDFVRCEIIQLFHLSGRPRYDHASLATFLDSVRTYLQDESESNSNATLEYDTGYMSDTF